MSKSHLLIGNLNFKKINFFYRYLLISTLSDQNVIRAQRKQIRLKLITYYMLMLTKQSNEG